MMLRRSIRRDGTSRRNPLPSGEGRVRVLAKHLAVRGRGCCAERVSDRAVEALPRDRRDRHLHVWSGFPGQWLSADNRCRTLIPAFAGKHQCSGDFSDIDEPGDDR